MPRAFPDLLQISPGLRRQVLILQGEGVEPYDGIHRGSDLMAHVRQENGFCLICPLRLLQSLRQDLISLTFSMYHLCHVRLEDYIEIRVLVNGVIAEPLIIMRSVYLAGEIYGVAVRICKLICYPFNRQSLAKLLKLLRRTDCDRHDLTVDILIIQPLPFSGENASHLNAGGVSYDHAVMVAHDIADHIILLREYLLVQGLRDHLHVAFLLKAKGHHITGQRVHENRSCEPHEALSSGSPLAVTHHGHRTQAIVITLNQIVHHEKVPEIISVFPENKAIQPCFDTSLKRASVIIGFK